MKIIEGTISELKIYFDQDIVIDINTANITIEGPYVIKSTNSNIVLIDNLKIEFKIPEKKTKIYFNSTLNKTSKYVTFMYENKLHKFNVDHIYFYPNKTEYEFFIRDYKMRFSKHTNDEILDYLNTTLKNLKTSKESIKDGKSIYNEYIKAVTSLIKEYESNN